MQRYIAFLRGINVGGHTVKMERLRAVFAELGFANVETFIASGNVIFETQAEDAEVLEQQIEEHLRLRIGYDVATFIRSASELMAVTNYQAFPPADFGLPGSSTYVAFLHVAPSDAVREKLVALRTSVDDFHHHEREIFWLCRTRLSESPVFSGGLFEKTIREPMTMRNMTTIRKLAVKYGSNGDDV
ncbi:MAG: DUF1697 domain-containing protein [Ktedonobacterales bacterium]